MNEQISPDGAGIINEDSSVVRELIEEIRGVRSGQVEILIQDTRVVKVVEEGEKGPLVGPQHLEDNRRTGGDPSGNGLTSFNSKEQRAMMNGRSTLETTRPRFDLPEAAERPGGRSIESPSWADPQEIDTFDAFAQCFRQGEMSAEEFKRFRLQHGVYAQRQPGLYMIRVRVPWGRLTADQLEGVADVAAGTPRGIAHVTTRQNLQLQSLTVETLTETLRRLAAIGLTTREACGNTVRNVVACPHAGVAPGEPFDVTPYAEATARFLLRNPMNQNLPRKFKISFTGCQDDCALAAVQDIGAVAVVQGENGNSRRGFRLYVGGGMGASPQVAQLLEEFTPAEDLLVTIAAIVRVFDRTGNRESRNLARLKFVLRRLGPEQFRALVFAERAGLRLVLAGKIPAVEERTLPPHLILETTGAPGTPSTHPEYRRWVTTNVRPQKQAGYAMVTVRLPLGDVTPRQLRTLALAARHFGDSTIRTTNQQNIVLRWIPVARLAALHRLFTHVELAAPSADCLADIKSCPGPETCQIGITASRGLAAALGDLLRNEYADLADDPEIRIKISGCPNACCHHHLASIGLAGGAKTFHGQQVPTYQVYVGASLALEHTQFGRPLVKVPAKNAPALVARLLDLYRNERRTGEKFEAFVERIGLTAIRARVEDLTDLPPQAEAAEQYEDWGVTGGFTVVTGPGECAS